MLPQHLRYCMRSAYESEIEEYQDHPQKVMDCLGIKYKIATPISIVDQWWFWNCEGIPNVLPDFLTYLNLDPMEQIGRGLSESEAREIVAYQNFKKFGV